VGAARKGDATKLIAQNRKARYEYTIEDVLEAGLALTGTEVKSCRAGKVSITDAYVIVEEGEAWLVQCHISPYAYGSRANHDPLRRRKLLLHRNEIDMLGVKANQQGRTLVPLRLYFKHGLVKSEIAIARGKKIHDKRTDIAKREADRRMRRELGRRR
jgi:SsrA-binding protein